MNKKGHDLEQLASDIPVARIEIILYQSGVVRVEGQITDKDFALSMLDMARDTVNNYHNRNKVNNGGILIPAKDTPLAGTEAEKRLWEHK